MTQGPFDLFVIGGGINGCGIARDAVGRGYSVMLAEMNDLASGTSSAATKLVHGGLRYLEHYEFRLVHEALAEREVLWAMAPHIIWPLRFVLPHHEGLRPAWLLRSGLFVYDYLGGRKQLPGTRSIDLKNSPIGEPLKPIYRRGFEYSDCWVEDARLVALTARDAADRGATIRTRCKVLSARRENGLWTIELADASTGATETVTAKLLVNASGPWVDQVMSHAMGDNSAQHVRLVKGSHLVIKQKFKHDRCYIFQNADGRVLFAIPYENDYTLIGTTDEDFKGDPATARIDDAEVDYLCRATSEYFKEPVRREDIVWTYSGVRPLYDDHATAAQEATRDYVLTLDGDAQTGAVLNVFGGKLTTYRRLAEEAVDRIAPVLGVRGARWTKGSTLPGGDFPNTGFEAQCLRLQAQYPRLDSKLLRRLTRLYGTRAKLLLGTAVETADLGDHFGADLYRREVDYLVAHEWATTAEDILWRRTKLGLRTGPEDRQRLEQYLAEAI